MNFSLSEVEPNLQKKLGVEPSKIFNNKDFRPSVIESATLNFKYN